MYRFILLIILVITLACSTQKKLERSYVGKSISQVEKDFGKAKSVLDRSEGKVYVFEKTEALPSTEIGQAKVTLDPMVSPEVTKTERFYVTVKNGEVIKIEQENEYERQ